MSQQPELSVLIFFPNWWLIGDWHFRNSGSKYENVHTDMRRRQTHFNSATNAEWTGSVVQRCNAGT